MTVRTVLRTGGELVNELNEPMTILTTAATVAEYYQAAFSVYYIAQCLEHQGLTLELDRIATGLEKFRGLIQRSINRTGFYYFLINPLPFAVPREICSRCGNPQSPSIMCKGNDECIDHNFACADWGDLCCSCGPGYAMDQI